MVRFRRHVEKHAVTHLGWLRAAVLGANDGVLSTSSLIVGVATAGGSSHAVLIAGIAGLVAGAMSMAAGEYVSVSSQADSERADLDRERQELGEDHEGELRELTGIYVKRGLQKELALQVAEQLTAKDALAAHAREELGIFDLTAARPIQAALASAAAFSVGAALPLCVAVAMPDHAVTQSVAVASLACLALLGVVAAKIGGAAPLRAAIRVTFWGALAMAVTAGVGAALGTQV
jgi:VIT1/CCC1 family predicted Fe2+/Mn2+ transporter